jgi:hypothetical protein
MLKAGRPDKYIEQRRLELTGANGAPLFDLSDTQRAARLAAILESAKREQQKALEDQPVDAEFRELPSMKTDCSDLL